MKTLIFQLLLISISVTSAADDGDDISNIYHACLNTTYFTPNTTFQSNLKTLLQNLSANTSTPSASGFLNITAGKPPDTAYGQYLCRGDITASACKACVSQATQELPKRCPGQKDTAIWYDLCMLRYSGQDMFSLAQLVPAQVIWKNLDVVEPERFMQVLAETMNDIVEVAASGNSTVGMRFSAKSAEFSGVRKVYTMAQCTPDLSSWDCNSCLRSIIAGIPGCCNGKQEGKMMTPSCQVRYGLYPFYNETRVMEMGVVPPDDRDEPSGRKGPWNNKLRTAVIIVIPTLVGLMLLAISYVIFRKRRQNKELKVDVSKSVESLRFNLSTVIAATDDFSDANKLGQGGFGSVYKGRLQDGEDIAVKRLAECSIQGEQEFLNEITLISRLQHKSLVRLLGFCLEGRERLLIYEYVPNASLDRLLYDPNKSIQLNWVRRYKIINGIARGLLYLHEDSQLNIIHRDMKPGNVLLDGEMYPKISDFGTARLFNVEKSRYQTQRIVGTYGYMAPEYAKHGHISVKTDVFSFGVIVLEIVTGKRSSFITNSGYMEHLLSNVANIFLKRIRAWVKGQNGAWKNWRQGTASNIIDQRLAGGSKRQILRYIHIGLLCVQENASHRPTMGSVVLMLNSNHLSLPSPSKPGFYMDEHSDGVFSEYGSKINDSLPVYSVNEVTITEQFPR